METNFYLVFSMARSGHHAFIYWLASAYPGEVIHYNNCVRGWEKKEFLPYSNRKQMYNLANFSEGRTARILNFEDFDLEDFERFHMQDFKIFQHSKVFIIVLVRDMYNWVASSMKIGGYADEFLNKPIGKDYMGLPNKPSRMELYRRQMLAVTMKKPYFQDFYGFDVSYNKWFTDVAYRKELAHHLKVPFSDKGLQDIPSWGGGSSFTRHKLQHKGQQMKVLERWKNYKGVKRYKKICNNPELEKLNHDYFRDLVKPPFLG